MLRSGCGQIIITAGDTGIVGLLPTEGSYIPTPNDRAVFTVRDKIGGRKLIEKVLEPDENGIVRVPFAAEDTEKLKLKEYVWDVRYLLDVQEDEKGNVTAYKERITPMDVSFLLVLPAVGGNK